MSGNGKTTRVVNKRAEYFDVYIGRGSMFGNPYRITETQSREQCIELYRKYFEKRLNNKRFRAAVLALRGKRLGCFCKPQTCHGDVIVEWLEGNEE